MLPLSGKDLELACYLADRAVVLNKTSSDGPWLLFLKGLADYRRGNHRAVAAALDPLVSRTSENLNASSRLVLAMACHQQGDTKAARQHLAGAARLLDPYLSDTARFPPFPQTSRYNHDWLIAWLLHREARTLIEGAKDEPKK